MATEGGRPRGRPGLEAVGIPPDAEEMFIALLRGPGQPASSLARALGLDATKARRLLRFLEQEGLISRTRGTPDVFHPVQPLLAVEPLVRRRQEQLDRVRAAAAALQDEIERARRGDAAAALVEVVRDYQAIGLLVRQMLKGARQEVLGFDKPPYGGDPPDAPVEPNAIETEMLAKGVAFRIVYDTSALEFPGVTDVALPVLLAAGEQARVFDGLPMKMAIVDRSVAILPIEAEDELGPALLIHAPSVVASLVMLFELAWARATPAALPAGDAARRELSATDARILTLLANGMKDRAIARHAGIAIATVERRVRRMMDLLGARTRFQAGLLAVDRGWLHAASEDERGSEPANRPGA